MMPEGEGIYDEICTAARVATEADAVIMVVLGGKSGSAFAMQALGVSPAQVLDVLAQVVQTMHAEIHGNQKAKH